MILFATNYCDGFVYNSSLPPAAGGTQVVSDTLQYILTGEGRLRPDSSSGLPAGGFTYDYFLRDHLGDVRTVITEQTSENTYAATMENKNAAVENQLFDNVSSTQYPTPSGFNNPVDTSNHYVSKLDGSNGNNTLPRVGPAIVLKVMAGDTITIATQAWYQGPVEPPPSGASNLLNDLLNALTIGVIGNSHGLYTNSDNNPNTILSGDLPQFFTNDENTNYTTAAPKAFLNYVAFDDQLNMNAANSGVVQVPQIAAGAQAQALVAPEQIIQKNGYIYIYVSNESAQKVFFDNLVIHHNKGHLLEEDQYYPFGLKMAGISDQALPVVPNNYLYNGKELQQNEFSDGIGLEDYDYGFRGYDPQIARFTEQDPLTDEFATVSPYQYALNDPVANIDKNGLAVLPVLTVTAQAVNRISAFSSFTSSIISEVSLASKIINFSSLGAHVLQIGGVLGTNWLTSSIGMEAAGNLGGPEDWYKNNKTGQISWINGSVSRSGYTDLGSTYKGYVNVGDKEYGFSGGSNGSVILSMELPELKVVSNNPCEYCLGGAGAYGPFMPTNRELIIATLAMATAPMGGEGGELAGLLDVGDASWTALGSKALIRGGVNVLAQTLGNKIVHPHESWVNSAENVNMVSALFSAVGVNFLTNAVYSANFNFNLKYGMQSTLTNTINYSTSAKAIVGGTMFEGAASGLENSSSIGGSQILNYEWQFILTAAETSLGF